MRFFKHFSKQNIIIWIFAFLFLTVSFVLSFFNLSEVTLTSGLTTELTGVNLCFGENLNGFILASWIFLLISLICYFIYPFFKNIKVLQGFSLIFAIIIYGCLPLIIDSPDPLNPEVNVYAATNYTVELICLIIFSGISFVLFFVLNVEEIKFSIREICELAMLIGLAVVLNFFPKIELGFAGSINFQIVPLVIIALRFSPLKSFLSAGAVFGLITCFTDGYGLFSFPLEYLIAFGSVAIISPFRNFILKPREDKKAIGYTLSILLLTGLILVQTTIRFFCASIDSYIFYYSYLDLSNVSTAFQAALIYNAPYVFVTGAITVGVIIVLYFPIVLINKRFKNR